MNEMNAMNDPRDFFARAVAQTESIIAAVREDQAGLPTPCAEWDVRTLVSHMTGVVIRVALVGEGADALSVSPFAELADSPAGDPAGNPPGNPAATPAPSWAAGYRAAVARADAAWADDAKLDAMFAVPWGKVPGRVALAGYVREVLAHGWDLAEATGQETELDQELGGFALAVAKRSLRADGRDGIPFGPVVEVPAGAGTYAQLAAWLGRTPRQDP
ncbi:MAG TPA: TIGR03086 family metal-binding protein [Trebonia sp.]|nr:TIGR03086 family metal-binding protein [Trebonia sp.]